MLRNFLTVAVRNLRRNGGTTAINIFGLAVSLAVVLLVLLFVREQWRIDRFHSASDRIHRVTTLRMNDGAHFATAPTPLPTALRESAPGIDAATAVDQYGDTFVVRGDTSLGVEAMKVDASFWQVFDGFQLRAGSRERLLAQPHTAVVTLEMARRLFGTDNPVGRTFLHEGETEYTVTGVLAPPDGPTHVGGDVFLSLTDASSAGGDADAWGDVYSQWTYVRLAEGTSASDLEATAGILFERGAQPEDASDYQLSVQSLATLRFGPRLWNEIAGRLTLSGWTFWFIGGLAAVLLIAAGFNYVSLSVAQSLRRAREVGVRKTLGAQQSQLVGQFLGEAIVTALSASVVATMLLGGFVPLFNNLYLLDLLEIPPLDLNLLLDPAVIGLIALTGVVVGLLAGAYPAFVLSSYRPAQTLRAQGDSSRGGGSQRLRSALIAVQVAVTLFLVVTATTMLRQTWHMATADHQLRTDRVASVALQDVPYDTFRDAVDDLPSVQDVAAINNLMLGPSSYDTRYLRSSLVETPIKTVSFAVDTSFVAHMGLTLRASVSNWDRAYVQGDGVLLNQAAVEKLGFDSPSAALGAEITEDRSETSGVGRTVVGVVDNFEYTGTGEVYGGGLADPEGPMMLYANARHYKYALVRAGSDDLAVLRGDLKDAWTERFDTLHPFEFRYYDDIVRMRYGPLQDVAYLTGGVGLLTILIAALGLLSLATYQVQTRTKEIGVRKALGASVTDVVVHLSWPFAVLLVGTALVTTPIAWVVNHGWLQWMPDAVDVEGGIVVLCVGAVVGVCLVTIGMQTVRAARLDPATTLRDE
ncbi:ABC transporter permease [Salinibacter altiplanensis]|uniref:ABC transporter permease n=1 Tax=Salinibacter altiplanensis TaxID=1803181 RepID=UPI000C9EE3E4|nr:ABC transporter permease [Salinibacter altiplanensis]